MVHLNHLLAQKVGLDAMQPSLRSYQKIAECVRQGPDGLDNWCEVCNTLDLMWVLRSLYEVYHSQYRSHLIVMIVNCAVRQMVTLRYIYKHIQVTNTLSALNVG